MSTSIQFKVYIIGTFVLSWILQILASIFAINGNTTAFTVLTTITMFMPTVGALAARVSIKDMGIKPKLKGKLKYYLFAVLSPVILSIFGALLYFAIFPQSFDPELTLITEQLKAQGVLEDMLASGLTPMMFVLINSLQAIVLGPVINGVLAIGEEIGWRGAMTPYLKEKYGKFYGRLVAGLIWGVWHWPLILLAGYEYGYSYFGAPILGLVTFCMFTTVMGCLLDFVYEKSGSIWAAAMMHGQINGFTTVMYLLKPTYQHMMIFGPLYIGIVSMVPSLLLALYVMKKEEEL